MLGYKKDLGSFVLNKLSKLSELLFAMITGFKKDLLIVNFTAIILPNCVVILFF